MFTNQKNPLHVSYEAASGNHLARWFQFQPQLSRMIRDEPDLLHWFPGTFEINRVRPRLDQCVSRAKRVSNTLPT